MHFFSSSNSQPPSPTSKRRPISWRPRTPEEIALRKNRRSVNQHLKRIGKSAKRDLSLNDEGVCVFTFKRFIVVVEVPEENNEKCLFYTKVCHLKKEDNHGEVERVVSFYNRKQESHQDLPPFTEADVSTSSDGTCPSMEPSQGSRLSIKGDEEVNLCLSVPIQGLTLAAMADHLEHFVKTAVAANRKLQKAKSLPVPTATASVPAAATDSPMRRARLWSVDSQTSVSGMSQYSLFSLFTPSSCSNLKTYPELSS